LWAATAVQVGLRPYESSFTISNLCDIQMRPFITDCLVAHMKKQKPASSPAPPAAGGPQKGAAGWPGKVSIHLAVILCIGLLAYANSFSVPFTLDDNSSIVDNPVIRNLSAFLSGAGYTYNPRRFVGYLTIALNHHFGGLEVAGYHAVNLAIHLANAQLVYLIARVTLATPFLRGEDPAPDSAPPLHALVPLFASLLFVVHPIQTQAVTYVIQRLASLATLFYLAALFCYIKARLAMAFRTAATARAGREGEAGAPFSPALAGWFTLSLACTIIAMRTKEITATLPLAVLLYEFSFFGADKKKRLLLLAPLLLTLLIVPIGLLTSGEPVGELLSDVSALTRETVEISRAEYLLTQFSVIATYLRLLLLPVNQNLDYDYPVYHSLFTPRVLFSFVLLALFASLAVWLYRKSGSGGRQTRLYRLGGFGIAWFFLALSVESSVIPIRDVIFEHRLYLPSFGFFLFFAAGAAHVARAVPVRGVVAAASVIVLSLAAATFARNNVWGDELRLWQDVLAKSPGKSRPYNNVGLLYKNRGEIDQAIPYFEKAVAIGQDFLSYDNLGVACYQKGRAKEAMELLERARALNPGYAPIYTNIGKICLEADDLQNAIRNLEEACRLAPDAPAANLNLGAAYTRRGDYDKAIFHLKRVLQHDPQALEARYNLGAAYYLAGSLPAAVQELETVLRLSPGHPEASTLLRTVTGKP